MKIKTRKRISSNDWKETYYRAKDLQLDAQEALLEMRNIYLTMNMKMFAIEKDREVLQFKVDEIRKDLNTKRIKTISQSVAILIAVIVVIFKYEYIEKLLALIATIP